MQALGFIIMFIIFFLISSLSKPASDDPLMILPSKKDSKENGRENRAKNTKLFN